jgi:hypothetical protein
MILCSMQSMFALQKLSHTRSYFLLILKCSEDWTTMSRFGTAVPLELLEGDAIVAPGSDEFWANEEAELEAAPGFEILEEI